MAARAYELGADEKRSVLAREIDAVNLNRLSRTVNPARKLFDGTFVGCASPSPERLSSCVCMSSARERQTSGHSAAVVAVRGTLGHKLPSDRDQGNPTRSPNTEPHVLDHPRGTSFGFHLPGSSARESRYGGPVRSSVLIPSFEDSLLSTRPATKPLTGTLAVVLLVAATRWGSYVGYAPLFLTDVLIAAAFAGRATGNLLHGSRPLSGFTQSSRPGIVMQLFLGYVVLRFATSMQSIGTFNWIRDAAPFLYGILAFASAAAVARSTSAERARTLRLLWCALIFHLGWTSAVILTGLDTSGLPHFPHAAVAVFTVRPDIDGAILGLTAGLLFRNVVLGRRTFQSVFGLAISVVTLLSMGTRAGLLSMLLSLSIAFMLTFAAVGRRRARQAGMLMMIPAILIGVVAIVPTTTVGQRLIATVDSSQTTLVTQYNARGTANARREVWLRVVDWTNESPARAAFGGGFGTDFLTDSDSIALLEGTVYTGVRSPHNWLVTSYARLGVVGAVLAVTLLVVLVGTVIRRRRQIADDDLLTMASLIVVAIIPVALVGVVLESPFGAIPFYWASGVVLALRGEERRYQIPFNRLAARGPGRGLATTYDDTDGPSPLHRRSPHCRQRMASPGVRGGHQSTASAI